ncbi:ThiF family adenylyltransferase [Tunturibacter empetritectus]|uniref:Adenylyltransferase/sulfurtransferase n=1 Tax=Tunturiibacter lichenicola TaxID=2051959 RepID=A0A7W8J4Y8_9BACT|nr:ThiF family adenylyltransferase [Edaphobacter lichenicola]MBB5342625.1 adenylyltransferase/sulfurtransferase [Edaphobacter lichenicola]
MSKHPAPSFEEPATSIHIGTPAAAQSSKTPKTVTTIPSTPNRAISHPVILDTDRYSRQILFPGIGATGQQLLASAHVAIIGVGATGAATASLLARAGVGTLTLVDRDFVEPSNLQRQILFDEADARDSLPKAEAARRKIALFNSDVTVHSHITDLVPANIHELLAPADLVLDATDNFETRYLLNDYCVQQSKPWIYAAAIGAYAATMNILPLPIDSSKAVILSDGGEAAESKNPRISSLRAERSDVPSPPSFGAEPSDAPYAPTACLACIFPKPPTGPVETCDTAGILSTAVNLAASIQTTEALKLLTNQPHLMRRTLLSHDLWSNERTEINTARPNPSCTVCGQRLFTHLAGEGRPHITLCGRNSVQIHEHHRPVDFAAMRNRLAPHADIHNLRFNQLLLRFQRGPHTFTLFPDGRALIQGTTDITLARSLYARFIGS